MSPDTTLTHRSPVAPMKTRPHTHRHPRRHPGSLHRRTLLLAAAGLVCGIWSVAAIPWHGLRRAAAIELAVDQAQQLDPLVKTPPETAAFSTKLLPLWEQALDRPDVEPRRLAIDTITLATKRGMGGLGSTVPRLVKALASDPEPQVRRAAAGALVALDASQAAAELAMAAKRDGFLVARLVEPALARWDHPPQREVWLERLAEATAKPNRQPNQRALLLLAIGGLGAVREPRAADTLSPMVFDRDVDPELRLAAAKSLGAIRDEGLIATAMALAEGSAGTGPGALGRILAVALLDRHSGEQTVTLLSRLAVDPEPAVASAALERLDEVDPGQALEIARRSLAVPDARQRHLAARLAARPGDADCITRLGPLLGDRNPALRGFVAGTLADFAADPPLRQAVIDQGLAALGTDQWRALEQGLLLLGHLDHEPAADRFQALLDHERDEVAVTAAWGLRRLQIDATLPALLAYATALRGGLQEQSSTETISRRGRQAQQLHQLFGIMRFRDAEPLLREYVPKSQIDSRARSAAFWALGLLHEDQPDCDLAPAFAERLADVASLPPESNVVRSMAAVGLGRFKAGSELDTLREFASRDTMYVETGIASHWAVARITGEPMPPEAVDVRTIGGWFLEPP